MSRARPPLMAAAAEERVRAWLAVGSVALGTFAMVPSEFLPIGLIGAIARDMGVADGRTGLMVTVPGLTAAFAAPAAALPAGRLDRRTLLVLNALILGSNLLVAGANSFGVLLAGRAAAHAIGPGFRRRAGVRAALGVSRRAATCRDQRRAHGHRVPARAGGRRQFHGVGRVTWSYGPASNPDLIRGEDIFTITDGKLASTRVFLNKK